MSKKTKQSLLVIVSDLVDVLDFSLLGEIDLNDIKLINRINSSDMVNFDDTVKKLNEEVKLGYRNNRVITMANNDPLEYKLNF